MASPHFLVSTSWIVAAFFLLAALGAGWRFVRHGRRPRPTALATVPRRIQLPPRIVRQGGVVPVLITDAEAEATPIPARVINRSVDRLVLEIDEEPDVREDTILAVRVADAGKTMPWVQVRVRQCILGPDGWVLDCPYVRTPCYGVRMLFG